MDLLLEIAARADVATVVRCAATSKHFRTAILEQGFRRRRRRLLNGRAAAGFDPSSVRGISYKLTDRDEDDICRSHTVRLLQTPPSDTAISRSRAVSLCLEPVAWRDGLVILRHSQSGELAACNRNTGHEAPLGDPAALAVSDDYPHALLTVDGGGGGGGSFELLVADKDLRFQTYSSRHGKGGAVVHAAAAAAQHHLHHPPSSQTARTRDPSKHPVVINGNSVHWLCGCRGGLDAGRLHIVALGVDTAAAGARATVIDLPRGCVSRMMGFKHKSGITLAVSADGRLSLVVSETQVISMWTSEVGDPDQITWSRRVVVDRQEWGVHASIRFEGFGERSGTLLFYMSYAAQPCHQQGPRRAPQKTPLCESHLTGVLARDKPALSAANHETFSFFKLLLPPILNFCPCFSLKFRIYLNSESPPVSCDASFFMLVPCPEWWV